VNILAWPGAPSVAELGRLGVARVSVGAGLARAALATTQQGARELLEQGTYRMLEHGRTAGDVNGMFFGLPGSMVDAARATQSTGGGKGHAPEVLHRP
jgi:hypothetical protein